MNAKGYGDYSDSFLALNLAEVEGEYVGCAVDDDFSQPLGNENEAMLSALNYRENGTCPALPSGVARHAAAPKSAIDYGWGTQPGRIVEPAFPGGLAVP